jgi:hypothetical protein
MAKKKAAGKTASNAKPKNVKKKKKKTLPVRPHVGAPETKTFLLPQNSVVLSFPPGTSDARAEVTRDSLAVTTQSVTLFTVNGTNWTYAADMQMVSVNGLVETWECSGVSSGTTYVAEAHFVIDLSLSSMELQAP